MREALRDFALLVITGLLGAILAVQVSMIRSRPPTLSEIREASTREERRQLLAKVPMVRVQGVDGTVEVDLDYGASVRIENEPLGVYLIR